LIAGFGVGDAQAKGYLEEDFTEVFRRYIPRSELESLLADMRGSEASSQPQGGNDPGAKETGAESKVGDPPSEAGAKPGEDAAAAA
jgi:hypothetical protein